MSGISRIQNLREEARENVYSRATQPFKEIWFKDGDQAFVTSVATGEDNDVNLEEISLYTFRHGNRFVNLLNEDGVDLSVVPHESRPSRKFAFWSYVHEIMHTEKRQEHWEEVVQNNNSGRKLFREPVNDYKIVCLGFGRNDFLWNQLVDVYNDWGCLDKGVMRIRRTGAGLRDTTYAISASPRMVDVPDDRSEEQADLPPIKEYFRERYGALWTPGPSNSEGETEVKEEVFTADLF